MRAMASPVRVMLFRAGTLPECVDVGRELSDFQGLVDGYIELVQLPGGLQLFCDEDGLSKGLPFNRVVTRANGVDTPIVGDFVVVRHDDNGEVVDLTDADVQAAVRLCMR